MDAVGVVRDLVVVRESKRKVNKDIFCESGVEVKDKTWESKWERSVDFPEPDSPLCVCY